jgi:hypothetical protein
MGVVIHLTILFSSSSGIDRDKRLHNPLDCDFLVKTSNCCLSGTFLSNAQSDLGVFTTYAGIKDMPRITRKLKGAVIDKG